MKITARIFAAACLISSAFSMEAHGQPTSLFNGKDLTGWKGSGYVVKDGAVLCTPKGKNLMTEKVYTNYVFEFEFKLPPGGNNGIGIHYPGHGNPADTGVEIQVLDDTAPKYSALKPYQFHGGFYFFQAAKKGHLKPVGEWNREKITVNGSKVTVELNGTVINEGDFDALAKKHPKHAGIKRRSGHIAFCGHGDAVQFRGMKITELPGKTPNGTSQVIAPPAPPKLPAGFVSLYNGKDLTGWSDDPGHIGHWQARGAVLHYDGKSTARDKNLWTEKEYADVALSIDWRWAAPASRKLKRPLLDPKTGDTKIDANGKPIVLLVDELDSGIYLRGNNRSQVNLWNWPGGSGEVYGYRTNKNHPQEVRAALTPSEKADKPIGEWNRMRIILKGDRLTVVLNGKTVITNAQLPGVPAKGKIALQHHGSAIEFANIYVKEL